jgi:hypothetical protein
MSCGKCAEVSDISDFDRPYVIRTCEGCGRQIKLRTPGVRGIGIRVEKGDRFVMPAGFLQFAANPLKGSGQFTRPGLDWFAELVFGVDIASWEKRENFSAVLIQSVESSEQFFREAPCLSGLDLEDADQAVEAWRRLNENPKSIEWWGYLAAALGSFAIESIKEGNASEAAWAATASERLRALAIFKSHFEEVVFMGHSARRLVDLLKIWDANKQNSSEGFWQETLGQHAYALNQLFSVPVTFIEGTAYVGGTKLDGGDARYLDFMLSGGSANHAILIEIKTPTTPLLLKQKYRKNVYSPSRELSGSIVQVNDYLDTLRKNINSLMREGDLELNVFNPKRVILIGNGDLELEEKGKRASFELFRSALSGIDIITFDEFFRKVEQLAKLFNLIRAATT